MTPETKADGTRLYDAFTAAIDRRALEGGVDEVPARYVDLLGWCVQNLSELLETIGVPSPFPPATEPVGFNRLATFVDRMETAAASTREAGEAWDWYVGGSSPWKLQADAARMVREAREESLAERTQLIEAVRALDAGVHGGIFRDDPDWWGRAETALALPAVRGILPPEDDS